MNLAWLESLKLLSPNTKSRFRGHHAIAAMLLLAPLSSAVAGTLYIGGTPPATINAPSYYKFRPWIAGSDKASAKFSINNKPYWASFDPNTGTLWGRVYPPNVGRYPNITITARSSQSSARMPSFSIVVGSGGTTTAGPPVISGSPSASVLSVGTAFTFQPTASDPAGRKLSFSVNTKPSWTSFDSATGRLFGTPSSANVGTTSNIVITASDGTASASLKAFSLTVVQVGNGSATLSWTPPTMDVNGNVLSDLAGYQIKYGTSSSNLSNTIRLANAGLTTYVITDLTPATYYFGVAAYTSSGTQSNLSSLVSKAVQ